MLFLFQQSNVILKTQAEKGSLFYLCAYLFHCSLFPGNILLLTWSDINISPPALFSLVLKWLLVFQPFNLLSRYI